MAVITATSFDPLKTRCNVRLQQGVPIVDADWNELDDIRKFEMRAYLKWFVGDGIPESSDAFRIDAISPGVADDFVIRFGVSTAPAGTANYDQGLSFTGRAIVDGMDVMIDADTNYKAQPLFAAAAFGVPQVAPMPNGAGPIAVYLDVWERLVTSQEDPSLVLPGIGTESCARMKREWVVRTRSGSSVPQPADPDFLTGHSYYLLAVITRSAPGATIAVADVADNRHLRLRLSTVESRVAFMERLLVTPTFAASPNQFNPKFGVPGANVTLFGNNFHLSPVSVSFGATAAALVGLPTSSEIVVTVPNMAPVPAPGVKITVQTAGGTATSADGFVVLPLPAPAFAAAPNEFNPKFGPAASVVTLLGTNFNFPPVSVRFGAAAATVTSVAAGQIIVTAPSLAAGVTTTITVQTAGGTITTVGSFTFV